MDLQSQIVRAYLAYNPGVNLSGFVAGGVVVAGGFARVCLAATGGGDRNLQVCGAFNATTGVLVQVFDSFSKYPGRWGYVHGPIHALGKYHSLTLDQPYPASASPNSTLYGPFEMAVSLAYPGPPAAWPAMMPVPAAPAAAFPTTVEALAIEQFTKAIAVDPHAAVPHVNLAIAYLRQRLFCRRGASSAPGRRPRSGWQVWPAGSGCLIDHERKVYG